MKMSEEEKEEMTDWGIAREECVEEFEETADKMFEKLGYKIMFDNTCKFRYVKHFTLKPARHIIFAIDKTISVCEENKNELAINRDYFTIQELQAINKKVEELGWI